MSKIHLQGFLFSSIDYENVFFPYTLLNGGIRLFSFDINSCQKCEVQTEHGLRFSVCLCIEAEPENQGQKKQGIKYGTFSSFIVGSTHSSKNNLASSPVSGFLRFGNKHHKQLQVLSPH